MEITRNEIVSFVTGFEIGRILKTSVFPNLPSTLDKAGAVVIGTAVAYSASTLINQLIDDVEDRIQEAKKEREHEEA